MKSFFCRKPPHFQPTNITGLVDCFSKGFEMHILSFVLLHIDLDHLFGITILPYVINRINYWANQRQLNPHNRLGSHIGNKTSLCYLWTYGCIGPFVRFQQQCVAILTWEKFAVLSLNSHFIFGICLFGQNKRLLQNIGYLVTDIS